jgi:uncharacterized protein with von Willebrand factor type A (vWA) domain
MEKILNNFIKVLRTSGVRISTSECIDAANAVDIIGCQNRESLKTALSAVLAKSIREEEIFHDCFDRFFSFGDFSEHRKPRTENFSGESLNGMSPLSRMLLSGNLSEIMTAVAEGANSAEISEIKLFTQKNIFIRRVLKAMGIDGLDGDIERLSGEISASTQEQALALKAAKLDLLDTVRDVVERQYDLYGRPATENLLESHLKNIKLSSLEIKDFYRMDAIIRKIVKRLNDVHSRRKRAFRKGQLDFKKTLRKNIIYEEILFDLQWKRKKIDRPDVIVICDVSRSVQKVVRFFLLFLYSLNKAIIRIRSYIFCSNLVEVSPIFDEYSVQEAVERMQTGTDLEIDMGRTDYGHALRDFKKNWIDSITRKTTVIILGDSRNNYGNPEAGILKLIQEKSKRIIWLNPETPSFWGTGDSEMKKYLPYCYYARECNTLNHLERAVDFIL